MSCLPLALAFIYWASRSLDSSYSLLVLRYPSLCFFLLLLLLFIYLYIIIIIFIIHLFIIIIIIIIIISIILKSHSTVSIKSFFAYVNRKDDITTLFKKKPDVTW